jgi:hypothetical protein
VHTARRSSSATVRALGVDEAIGVLEVVQIRHELVVGDPAKVADAKLVAG